MLLLGMQFLFCVLGQCLGMEAGRYPGAELDFVGT